MHDDDDVALGAILAEWTSGRTFEQRIANLTDGSGTAVRANGDVFLTPGGTVLPDGAADELFGNLGRDWFFAFNEDLAQDFVEDVDVMA